MIRNLDKRLRKLDARSGDRDPDAYVFVHIKKFASSPAEYVGAFHDRGYIQFEKPYPTTPDQAKEALKLELNQD